MKENNKLKKELKFEWINVVVFSSITVFISIVVSVLDLRSLIPVVICFALYTLLINQERKSLEIKEFVINKIKNIKK